MSTDMIMAVLWHDTAGGVALLVAGIILAFIFGDAKRNGKH